MVVWKKGGKNVKTYFHVLGNIFIWVEMEVWLEPVDKYQERDNLVRPIESNSKMWNKLDFCTYYYLSIVVYKEYIYISEMSMNNVLFLILKFCN